MTAYRVGDIPAVAEVFEITDDIPVASYTSAPTGVLTDPDGEVIDTTGATFVTGSETEDEGDVEPIVTVTWGVATSLFTVPGLHHLTVTLHGTGAIKQALPSFPIVVEAEDGWLTISNIRRLWRDAPVDDEDVFELLEVSKAAVIAFAPALADTDPVPANYRKGQRMQARNVWNAAKVDPSNGSLGEDTFVIRPVPLDWQVKQVLRPKTALPWVG